MRAIAGDKQGSNSALDTDSPLDTGPHASGEYAYLCDGIAVPIQETWQLYRHGENFELRSERRVPEAGVVISARANIDGAGLERCHVQWRNLQSGDLATESFYHAEGTGGFYRWRQPGRPARSKLLDDSYFFPLLRVFAGALLTDLSRAGGGGRVLVPWIVDPSDVQRLLEPALSERRVEWLRSEPWGEEGEYPADCYRYSGAQYGDDTRCWLWRGLLLGYRWQQGQQIWQIKLKNLQGNWPGAELWPHPVAAAVASI